MSSHFISYFERRAESIRRQALAAGSSATLSASTSSTSSARNAGINSEAEALSTLTGEPKEGCTFCDIVKGEQNAFTVYEDEHVLAFLDILPIREGHLLVVPKAHFARVSHLPDEVSAAIGRTLPRISRALCAAVHQPDFNIVSNQGYAQIVHHVHFHLVPAPLPDSPVRSGWASILGRDELDEEEAKELCERIRAALEDEKRRRGAKL